MNCPKCNGTKFEEVMIEKYNDIYDISNEEFCSFCNGKGDINWIENVFGVQVTGIRIWGQRTLFRRNLINETD